LQFIEAIFVNSIGVRIGPGEETEIDRSRSGVGMRVEFKGL
jgi:hypothetical protein